MDIPIDVANSVVNDHARGVLIAQIGRGNYKKTKYQDKENNGDTIETGYTFEAILKQLISAKYKVNAIMLVGTETSFWGSLCYYFYHKGNPDVDEESFVEKVTTADNVFAGVDKNIFSLEYSGEGIAGIKVCDIKMNKIYVEKFLTKYLGLRDINVKISIVQNGVNNEQLNDNFDILKTDFEETFRKISNDNDAGERYVYFDISNGFRSIPMYIYAFVNYLGKIQNQQYRLIMYYGMYEAATADEIKPLVNMHHVNLLTEWLNAANEFNVYGNVYSLIKLLEKPENEKWQKELGEKISSKKSLVDIFGSFEQATNSNNLEMLRTTIKEICLISKKISSIEKIPIHSRELLNAISKELCNEFPLCLDRNEKWSTARSLSDLSKWYFKQRKLGSAATAFQEGLLVFVMDTYKNETKAIIGKKRINFRCYHQREMIGKVFSDNRSKNKDLIKDYNAIRIGLRNSNAHFALDNNNSKINFKELSKKLEKWIGELQKACQGKESDISSQLPKILSVYIRQKKQTQAVAQTE